MIRLFCLAASISLVVASSATASTVDFTQTLTGLDHKPMSECKEPGTDGKCAKIGPVTLGEVSAAALSISDRNAPLEDQIKRGRLAQRVIDGKAVDLTAEETKMIKDQLGKLGTSPTVVFEVVKAIDPAAVK